MLFRSLLFCWNTAYSVNELHSQLHLHMYKSGTVFRAGSHTNKTHTSGWQCRIRKKVERLAFKPVWKTPKWYHLGFARSRAELMFHSNPGQERLRFSPHRASVSSAFPVGFLLFPHFTFLSGLHPGCITVLAMWTQNKDLSSPVRVALVHTIARHRQSDSLVLLGCSAPVSSLTHTAAAPQDSEPELLSRSFMTRTAVTRR